MIHTKCISGLWQGLSCSFSSTKSFFLCVCICKLAVLPGARLHKLVLHIAEFQNPPTREHVFLGSVWWPRTECGPRAQQGLGARSARGGRWLVPAAADVRRGSCHGHKRRTSSSVPTPWPQIPVPVFSLSSSSFSLSLSLSFDPSVCLRFL